jgi:pimeloyl-ACP methyl ester carboxylesterase
MAQGRPLASVGMEMQQGEGQVRAIVPPEGLEVRLIGELALLYRQEELPLPASKKTRALFVYLLLARRPVRRERLCELFFDIPDDPRAALRWSLSKIRTMLGPFADLLVANRERVEFRADDIVTDVDRFRLWADGAAVPDDLPLRAEAALESPLQGLDLDGLDTWNAWLAAVRAEMDGIRAEFLALAARDERLSPQHRHLLLQEAQAAGAACSAPSVQVEVNEPAAPAAEKEGAASPGLDQAIHYCAAPDGVRIAYACTGAGPPLVKAANWLNHLELDWSGPVWGRLFGELSRDHRLVRYDERGNGLSDWDVEDLSFEAFVRDLETVVDTLALDRFPLLGISQGCAVSIEYAARHPDRVSKLILLGGYAAGWRYDATPEEAEQREAVITLARMGWGQDNPVYRQIFSQTFMPSASAEELDWFNTFQRRTATPGNAVRFLEAFSRIDVRHRLATINAPVLVIHARDDQRVPLAHGIELASNIPNATLVTLDTDNHIPLSREPATEKILECIATFLRSDLKREPMRGDIHVN